ncbi:hypothetical protein EDB80DRAFT_820092 [Ilyonectria destructans]|nr:hypothetical protein EDB80DRAFT_820092 [Ilyonectria destructans]
MDISNPVTPMPVQGAFSYTVAAADSNEMPKVVQFRILSQGLHFVEFARILFFTSVWNNRPSVKQPFSLLNNYYSILNQVSYNLPKRLQAKLDEVRQGLPLLFRPSYPMAFRHDDLLENNIHVDEATGHITGIVDWPDAIIAPFGVSLAALRLYLAFRL